MDRAWWRQYVEEVDATFRGERFSNNGHIAKFRTTCVKIMSYGNSGAAAISLGAASGAKEIILLGYDCKYGDDGKRHWHGDHPKGLGNAARIDNWRAKFERLSKEIPKDCRVINASRSTALECFERASVEDVLV